MRISEVFTRDVVCIEGDRSVREAAQLMRDRHVGALVVVEQPNGERTPVGMLTGRDIVIEVIAAGVSPDALSVADVMSRDPITCDADQDLVDAVELMRLRGVRRLPVVNLNGGVVGLVAIDDALSALIAQLQALTRAVTVEQVHERTLRP